MDRTRSDRLQALADALEAQQAALLELTNLVELQGKTIVALLQQLKSPERAAASVAAAASTFSRN